MRSKMGVTVDRKFNVAMDCVGVPRTIADAILYMSAHKFIEMPSIT